MAASDPTTEARPAWNRTQDPGAWVGVVGSGAGRRRPWSSGPRSATALGSFEGLLGSLGLHPHRLYPSNSTCAARNLPSRAETLGRSGSGVSWILPSGPRGPSLSSDLARTRRVFICSFPRKVCSSSPKGGDPASLPARRPRPTPWDPGLALRRARSGVPRPARRQGPAARR